MLSRVMPSLSPYGKSAAGTGTSSRERSRSPVRPVLHLFDSPANKAQYDRLFDFGLWPDLPDKSELMHEFKNMFPHGCSKYFSDDPFADIITRLELSLIHI